MKHRQAINPMLVLAAHQKVGNADAAEIQLPVLIHFDAAKRGLGTEHSANFLTKHLVISLLLGSKSGNRAFYDLTGKAYDAMHKACARQTEYLAFTTGEYQALRTWLGAYFRAMPGVSVGMMNYACAEAQKRLDALDTVAA